ncbi:MAG: hypothetical protein SGPRY_009253, partial [Prymnesium sp.]
TLYLNTLANKKKHDLKRDVCLSFQVGDKVLVVRGAHVYSNLPKAEVPSTGPYTICKVLSNDNYLVRGPGARRFRTPIHVERLIPFLGEQTAAAATRNPVEAVISHRSKGSSEGSQSLEYRIRWLGFNKSYDSWNSVEYLSGIPHLLQAYHNKHGLPPVQDPTLSTEEVSSPLLPLALSEARGRDAEEVAGGTDISGERMGGGGGEFSTGRIPVDCVTVFLSSDEEGVGCEGEGSAKRTCTRKLRPVQKGLATEKDSSLTVRCKELVEARSPYALSERVHRPMVRRRAFLASRN